MGATASGACVPPRSVAYMYYCDGTSFSGDLETPVATAGGKYPNPIYFRGRRILDANLADLTGRRGLGSAAAVVLSGHSAGGLATYLHGEI